MNAVYEYLSGRESMNSMASKLGIAFQSFKQWVHNYEAMGADAFGSSQNKHYSKAEKEQAVKAYLAGEGSLMEICKQYKIASTTQLRSWIKKYQNSEKLKASGSGDTKTLKEGRKTTYQERMEIAEFCIAHDCNYAEGARTFNVSYQQARNYTLKYEKGGAEALQDRRGKRKENTSEETGRTM